MMLSRYFIFLILASYPLNSSCNAAETIEVLFEDGSFGITSIYDDFEQIDEGSVSMFYGLENIVNTAPDRFLYLIPRLTSRIANKKPILDAFETIKLIDSIPYEQSPEQMLTAVITELAIWDQIGEQVWDRLRAIVWRNVKSHIWGEIVPLARAKFGLKTGVNVWFQLWYQVKYELNSQLKSEIWDKIGHQVGKHVEDRVGHQVWNHIGNRLEIELDHIQSKSGYKHGDLDDFFEWAIDYAFSSYQLASFRMRSSGDFLEVRNEISNTLSDQIEQSKILGILNIYKYYFPDMSLKGNSVIETELKLVKKSYSR